MYRFASLLLLLSVCISLVNASVTTPSRTVQKRQAPPPNFIQTSDGQFIVNGSEFKFIGTNAYWLSTLNSDQDIDDTLGNISAAGIKVVRTWGFNDVTSIPVNGTWLNLVVNGTTTVNNGTNGLQRLDKLVELAEKHGIYLMFSLTNNWNPQGIDNSTSSSSSSTSSDFFRRDITPGTNNTLPRNFLSNDYGGMDVYVREFGVSKTHDEFYTNDTIIEHFKNYTTQVVSRFTQSAQIFGWEIANDPRCNSSVSASSGCNAQTVTKWHSTIAQHIASVDPNHLVSSGNQGFFCTGCPKLFPRQPNTPTPSGAPAPGKKRRSPLKRRGAITKADVLKERVNAWRESRNVKKRSGALEQTGVKIRGRWASTMAVRQNNDLGSAFDGSQGVDSEDIINIPEIGFGSFQLFPDQEQYSAPDPNLPSFNNTVQSGLNWIQQHAATAATFGKPTTLTGFGLVTLNNTGDFVPFNQSTQAIGADQVANTSAVGPTGAMFVNTTQQQDAYEQWLSAGIASGLNGMIQYQWNQGNLTTSPGTTISQGVTGISQTTNTTGQSPTTNTTSQSPNDGYANQGIGQDGTQAVLSNAAQAIGVDT